MDIIKLTEEKLKEIINKANDKETIDFYLDAALNNRIEATQHRALLILLLVFIRHYHNTLFATKKVNLLDFFGLHLFNESSEYLKYMELLDRTDLEVFICIINNEHVPDMPLIEFSELHSYAFFCFSHIFKSLKMCENALRRDKNNTLCNFIKASMVELCYVNKTSIAYKIALSNYQKELIDNCNPDNFHMDKNIFNLVYNEITTRNNMLDSSEKKLTFTRINDDFEETKKTIPEWTEEHDFYIKHNLFLNPLSNFDHFAEASNEEFEDLETCKITEEHKQLFDAIITDYKSCRFKTFCYCHELNVIDKRELAMTYSYAYSIFDKIAYLLKNVYNLDINEDNVGFTKKNLFDVKLHGKDLKFGSIRNNNILPLYLIMKSVREKCKIENALQVGTLQHNELRNTIDHKSINLVNDDKLKTNAIMILELTRDAILHTFMLLYSCYGEISSTSFTSISTTLFNFLVKSEENKL